MSPKQEHSELKARIFGLPAPVFYKMTGLSFLTCLVLGLLIVPSFLFSPQTYEVGEIAQETIKAKRTYEDIIDEEHTAEKLAEAEASVKDVFDYDKNLFSKKAQRISESFKILREKEMKTEKDILDGKSFLENKLNVKIEDQLFYYLRILHFREKLEATFTQLLQSFDQEMIVASSENLPQTSFTLRDNQERLFEDIGRIKVKLVLQKYIERDKDLLFVGYKSSVVDEFTTLMKALVEPNLLLIRSTQSSSVFRPKKVLSLSLFAF